MKIAPLKVSDPWYGRILSYSSVQTESLHSVPIECTVEMELVELLHGGPEENYRPYLHLRGELTEAVPSVELPYGVTELALRRGAGLNMDAFYDFNPRQLQELVGKGYFTEQFRVPDEMAGIPWALPGLADFLVVAPEYSDQPPVVFMSVHNQSEMELDQANSGYDLSSYFPAYDPQTQDQIIAAKAVDSPTYGGSGLDVFDGVDFDERQPSREPDTHHEAAEQDMREPVPSGIFERLMSEIDARRVTEPVVADDQEPEVEVVVPGSPADLYFSRVSPGVEQVLSGEPVAGEYPTLETERSDSEEALLDATMPHLAVGVQESDQPTSWMTAGGFLDLSEPDPELTPLGVRTYQTEEDESEAHHKAIVRRTTRIRSELLEAEAPENNPEAQPGL